MIHNVLPGCKRLARNAGKSWKKSEPGEGNGINATVMKIGLAQSLNVDKTNAISDIYKPLNISWATLYHYFRVK
jgi:hypothetical protein